MMPNESDKAGALLHDGARPVGAGSIIALRFERLPSRTCQDSGVAGQAILVANVRWKPCAGSGRGEATDAREVGAVSGDALDVEAVQAALRADASTAGSVRLSRAESNRRRSGGGQPSGRTSGHAPLVLPDSRDAASRAGWSMRSNGTRSPIFLAPPSATRAATSSKPGSAGCCRGCGASPWNTPPTVPSRTCRASTVARSSSCARPASRWSRQAISSSVSRRSGTATP